MTALVSIQDLTVQFRTDRGWITAVEDVSFDIAEGDCLGMVGESGSGKSVTALSMLRLHAKGSSRIVSGRIIHAGQDLLLAEEAELRRIRGRDIAMVFQDPMSRRRGCTKACRGRRRASARSSCSTWCESPTPGAGSTSTRTGCRAGCASA